MFTLLLLKKLFLDDRAEEENLWKPVNDQIIVIKDKVSQSIDFANNSINLLRRKAEVICKCFRKLESYDEMIQNLVSLLKMNDGEQNEVVKRKQFAMYNFELLSEYHLSEEFIVQNSSDFIQLFTNTLQENNILVKVASLKAISIFLSSIDDEDEVLKYKGIMEGLLQVVIEVMKEDETQGQSSLEALIELTSSHGEIWNQSASKLIFVVSEVIKNREFEDNTRQSALEIIGTLAETLPPLLRKHSEDLKNHMFPALAYMMTEIVHADDLEAWYAEEDTELQTKTDPASVAADALQRIAAYIGEKTTLLCSSVLIKGAIESNDWKEKCMGFNYLGMISDACKKQFKQNIDDVAKMAVSGFSHENPRVRFEALQCTGLLLTDLAPVFQEKYYAELLPAVLNLINTEQHLKMQTQAVAVLTSLVKGLIDEESPEDSETNLKNKKLLLPFANDITAAISLLLQKAIDQNYAPL